MRNRLLSVGQSMIIALLLGAFFFRQTRVEAQLPQMPAAPGVQNLIMDADGVQFTLHTPSFSHTAAGELVAPGLSLWQEVGAPLLPVYQTWVAVPAGAAVEVAVQPANIRYEKVADVRTIAPSAGVSLAPHTISPDDVRYAGLEATRYTPLAPNTTSRFEPTLAYDVSPVQMVGDVAMVSLTLYPLQYNAATQMVRHLRDLQVTIHFRGGNLATSGRAQSVPTAVRQLLLNPSQADQFQGAAAGADAAVAPTVDLPTGQTAYKIAVDEDGLYDITYAQLAALGLAGNIPAASLQMMHNGQSVAFQHLDANSNTLFDAGDALRFYGWAFDGPRFEKFYVTDNIFWLWVSGTATPVASANAAPSGAGTAVTTTVATLNWGEDLAFWQSAIYQDDWAAMPNDPDYLYWRRLYPDDREDLNLVTLTLPITLPHPIAITGTALITAELQSLAFYNAGPKNNEVNIDLNSQNYGFQAVLGVRDNHNAVLAVPQTDLLNGVNTLTLRAPEASPPGVNRCSPAIYDCVLLNEVHVSYTRGLTAANDLLQFTSTAVGLLDFAVDGFSTNQANQIVVWDISDHYHPVLLTGAAVAGAQNSVQFSRNTTGAAQFVVLTAAQVRPTTGQITAYNVADITPAPGADWLAITHSAFASQATRLATHRTADGYQTAVVDVQDIINQYGYGFAAPAAIHRYLQEAVTTWAIPPRYVVLMGAADYNPRLLACKPSCSPGSSDFAIFNDKQIPTYFTFRDRFEGLTPSDYDYSLLVGDDYLPDLAIGRLPATSLTEAQNMVDKIILYENNQLTRADWQRNVAFLHDNTDSGGDFLAGVQSMASFVPESYHPEIFGLTLGNTPTETAAVREQLFQTISATNISILAYRGHGSVDLWAGELLLQLTDIQPGDSNVGNTNRPMVSLSMDCLDGNFGFPGWDSISEAMLKKDGGRASAAHWSSSGLGYDFEHKVLADTFFNALFNLGLTRLGDTINYTKGVYNGLPFLSKSELYTFALQGDPAMHLYRAEWNVGLDVPAALAVGETFTAMLTISNTGLYPSRPMLTYTLPANVAYITATNPLTHTFSMTTTGGNGQALSWDFSTPLAYQETTAVAVQLQITSPIDADSVADVSGTGGEMSPATGLQAIARLRTGWNIYLPFIRK